MEFTIAEVQRARRIFLKSFIPKDELPFIEDFIREEKELNEKEEYGSQEKSKGKRPKVSW